MITAPMFGWFITQDEIKTKVINCICVLLIGLVLIVYRNYRSNQK